MKTIEEIEARLSAIKKELESPDADLKKLEEEVRTLNAEKAALKAKAKEAEETRRKIAEGLGTTKEAAGAESANPSLEEIRSSAAYVEAYANYIKTGNDKECRTLLSKNAETNGQVPVPTIVDTYIRTAWEKNSILSRTNKTYLRGNVQVAFELSATDAAVHEEGKAAPAEEELTFGIVTMTPANIKKWIKISDEAVDMGGEEFLRYIYDELTHRITLALAKGVVEDIATAPTSSSATAVGVPKMAIAPSVITAASGSTRLSDEAENLVLIMNRLTHQNFLAAYAAGNFAIDPFAGFQVLYSSKLPAYDSASAGDVYAIVGDLRGMQVNFPNGDDVIIKWDDLSLAELDLVKVVGREYVAHAITSPGRFVNLTKPNA